MSREEKVVLGIESTAHTFGVGLATTSGKILANIYEIYTPKSGGIHPREAAQHHALVAPDTIKRAIQSSNISLSEIGGVAFSAGPGMGPCLRVGATVARALSLKLRVPLIAVNHGVAHIEIGRLTTGCRDPVVLYVAGGNTLITSYQDGRYRIFGETLDIAAGNCLDVFGIKMGIGSMPNPEIRASYGEKFYPLPYKVKGMDVSFSGILTAALKLVKEGVRLEDICYSLVETVYSMLTEVTERALAFTEKKEVLIVGGLSRSKRLRKMMDEMVKLHDAKAYVVPDAYAGDNGAMIAWTGALQLLTGQVVSVEESRVRPRYRIDEVDVKWFHINTE
ncbi:MAG: KEOPS complex N(6)-L-threonylcarbamoyladenine synthase Kae1 [Aigarchaeota archaeon]|nr:KEOPS complex N(6)-L-threonylcarbamoyladenine synthase Kae1 [Aigarchaeota archaeon]MCX8192739.1 KEOPS complex N(6)-L-threonylcarbamoyladenine synthase Kae1 [Nitrososphaeria archaeon]MDW7985991.1 KEOPS complex N(6)-L-threonylcarbamoyladenine synthase Kae1 [Nitrososphaerota archaeon]